MTLAYKGCQPKASNDLLKKTCTSGEIAQAYQALKKNEKVDKDFLPGQVKLDNDSNAINYPCYFIPLKNPVIFKGVTKICY